MAEPWKATDARRDAMAVSERTKAEREACRGIPTEALPAIGRLLDAIERYIPLHDHVYSGACYLPETAEALTQAEADIRVAYHELRPETRTTDAE
jgi:hypothetical protein